MLFGVLPFLDFSVAVRKGKAARAVVIARWIIPPSRIGIIRIVMGIASNPSLMLSGCSSTSTQMLEGD